MIATSTEISYFIETYQTRHISKASIRLGVSQPALTQCLQKLEEKLSTKLFHRTKQGVIPTNEGTAFYKKARMLSDAWDEIEKGILNRKSEIHGYFKLGCHPSVGTYTLSKLFENLSKNAPGIKIELIHDFSRKITESIVSYEIDLGFVVNPRKHPDLVLKKLGNDRVMLWKRKGLQKPPKRIFADAHLAQVEDVMGNLHKKNFQEWDLVSSSSLELIRSLTMSGQGIGLLPERIATADHSDLVPYDQALPIYEDEIFLAYRKDVITNQGEKELVRLANFSLPIL